MKIPSVCLKCHWGPYRDVDKCGKDVCGYYEKPYQQVAITIQESRHTPAADPRDGVYACLLLSCPCIDMDGTKQVRIDEYTQVQLSYFKQEKEGEQ